MWLSRVWSERRESHKEKIKIFSLQKRKEKKKQNSELRSKEEEE